MKKDQGKSRMDGDTIIDSELEFRIKIFQTEIEKLKKENTKLRILLKELGHEEYKVDISDEEAICIEQISMIKKISANRQLDLDEVKRLDVLHKNLKLARGETGLLKGEGRTKKLSNDELIKIAKGK